MTLPPAPTSPIAAEQQPTALKKYAQAISADLDTIAAGMTSPSLEDVILVPVTHTTGISPDRIASGTGRRPRRPGGAAGPLQRPIRPPRAHADTVELMLPHPPSLNLTLIPKGRPGAVFQPTQAPSSLAELGPPPPCTALADFAAVATFMETQLSSELFSVAALRRNQCRYLSPATAPRAPRPHAMDVRAMYDPVVCAAGARPLPPGSHGLLVDGWDTNHLLGCSLCRAGGHVDLDCYWNKLRLVVTNGFNPPFKPDRTGAPIPEYQGMGPDGNHSSMGAFPLYAAAQFAKLRASGVIVPTAAPTFVSPMGVAVPNTHRQIARTLTGIDPVDDASHAEACRLLAEMGLPPVKRRMIMDMRGSGINDMMQDAAFSYITLSDIIGCISPGCYTSVMDIEGYYHNFRLAEEYQGYAGMRYEGQDYRHPGMPFGGKQMPYLASTMTAEISAAVTGKAIKHCAMIDDWLVATPFVGVDTPVIAASDQLEVLAVIKRTGLNENVGKRQEPSQDKTVFTGFRLDSLRMVISANPESAGAFLGCFRAHQAVLRAGANLSLSIWHHVCGKLSYYAEMAQEGRGRLSLCWAYLKWGSALSARGRELLLLDLAWWDSKLEMWAAGRPADCEYPILNGHTLRADPGAISILVSDASGPHGVGGIHGHLGDSDPATFSYRWPEGYEPSSSFVAELVGLHVYLDPSAVVTLAPDLENTATGGLAESPDPLAHATSASIPPCTVPESPQRAPTLLLWVTDNLGAALAINAGRAKSPEAFGLVRKIFAAAASSRVTIVALWHPREHNVYADYLSHLSFLADSPSITGTVSSIGREFTTANGGGPREQEECEGGGSLLHAVPAVLRGTPSTHVAADIRERRQLPRRLLQHPQEPGQLDQWDSFGVEDSISESHGAFPHSGGGGAAAPPPPADGPGRRDGCPAGHPAAVQPHPGGCSSNGPNPAGAASRSHHRGLRAEHAPADSGDNFGDHSGRYFMVQGPQWSSAHPTQPYEDLQAGFGDPNRGRGVNRPLLGHRPAPPPLGGAEPSQQPRRVRVLRTAERDPAPDHQGLGDRIPRIDQADGGFHRPGPLQVLRPLPPGGGSYGPVHGQPPVLRHQEDGTLDIGRRPDLLQGRRVGGSDGGQGLRRGP